MVGRTISRLSSCLKRLLSPTRSLYQGRSNRLLLEVLEDRALLNGTTLLVQLKPGFNASVFATPTTSNLLVGADLRATRIDGLFQLEVNNARLPALTNLLRNNFAVAYAEPQTTYTIQLTPNDPNFTNGNLWGLNGTFGIDAPQAWDTTTGTTTPIVAVIDTGVDYRHVDLFRNIWINQGEIPASVRAAITSNASWDTDGDGLITFWDLNDTRNQGIGKITDLDGDGRITGADILRTTSQGGWSDGVDADANNYRDDLVGWNFINNTNNPLDDNNHGTHVAGTIGGVGNNSTGMVGVNWKVQIMALKFLDAGGSGSDFAAATAVRYAANNGSQVSNNSWGGGGFSNTLVSAIDYARTRDHLFIAAAGNDGRNTDTTANYPSGYNLANILSVAATTSGGNLASFSNYGLTTVDLGAPGQNIYSTIPNNGYASFSGTSMATPHVAGAAALLLAQNPSLTYAELKDRLLNTTSPLSALQSRTVSGGLLNIGNALQNGPEITVLDGTTNLTDGTSTVSFGSTFAGVPVSKTFTVRNTGNQTLTLANPITVPTGFTLTGGFTTLTLASGASTTFTVRFDATTNGTSTGQLSFGNNDVNENPFNFTLTGAVSSNLIIDNADAGYSETGQWSGGTPGYGGTHRYSSATSGTATATTTWQAANLPAGNYEVAATWTAFPNHSSNQVYSIYDGNTLLRTLTVNQINAPSGTTVNGTVFQSLGNFSVSSGTLRVVTTNSTTGGSYVTADAVLLTQAAASVPAVDLNWSGGGITAPASASASTPFTINRSYNIAGAAAPSSFTIAYYASSNSTFDSTAQLIATETVSGSANLSVGIHTGTSPAMTLTSSGTYYLYARLNSDNAFTESNTGNNLAQAPNPIAITTLTSVIIDYSQPGYSETGSWATSTPGYGGTHRYTSAVNGTATATATWQATGLAPGVYDVSATWTAYFNHSSNQAFSVYDGNTLLGTFTVDEINEPIGVTVNGSVFQSLGAFTITSGTVRVVTSNSTSSGSYVTADAVRIAATQTTLPTVDLNWTGGGITGPASAAAGTPFTIDRAYNIAGGAAPADFTIAYYASTSQVFDNSAQLIGTESISGSANLSTGLHNGTSSALTINGSGTYYLYARLNADSAFPESVAANNVTQAPQQVNVPSAAGIIVDNGQPGYSETGQWNDSAPGYNNSHRYASAVSGTATATATWQVTGLAAGNYDVSATWTAWPNHSTNQVFLVYDGDVLLGTFTVNEINDPVGVTVNGRTFQSLGSFAISSGTLRVVTTNSTSDGGYVTADAVRVVAL